MEQLLQRMRLLVALGLVIGSLGRWTAISANATRLLHLGAAVVMFVAAAFVARRTATSSSAQRVEVGALVQLSIDAAASMLLALSALRSVGELGWIALMFPVIEAGLRYRLLGVTLAWGAANVVMLIAEFVQDRVVDPAAMVTSSALVLVVALSVAALAEMLFDELSQQAVDRMILDERLRRMTLIMSTNAAVRDSSTAESTIAAALDDLRNGSQLWRTDADGWRCLNARSSAQHSATTIEDIVHRWQQLHVSDAADRLAMMPTVVQRYRGALGFVAVLPHDAGDPEPASTAAAAATLMSLIEETR